ncbi:class I SAM-dependent methyltransferase [Prosthecobacter sp.]|uniref:class I SAM-dependent methyltransferase n=1 Tax=Prosthecobacter sp. TaxID=1965333 RepID=UPI002AB9B75C|nr:class I SAM-dependent methyltransferase [Prosthecobacter sp.]MDZ4401092.1 class I SAM-dependent methyltransferase [Prosthecobacter sp.]
MSSFHPAYRELLTESPCLHGEDGQNQWSLAQEVMDWLTENVRPGDRTLETGCGYSTLIFAMAGAQHTVISPIPEEHDHIRRWGLAHGVDFSKVTFIAAKSEDVLPNFGPEPLDLVLIDGWHAMPAPFIDWFFTCTKLAVGGRVMVDDTQILPCRILREFLEQETGRWSLERRFKRTDVFRKLKEQMFEGDWRDQPWGARPILTLADYFRLIVRPTLVRGLRRLPGIVPAMKKLRSLIQNRNKSN